MKKLLKKAFLVMIIFSLAVVQLPFYSSAVSGTTSLTVSDSSPAFDDLITVTVAFNLSDNAFAVLGTLKYSADCLEYVSGNNANMSETGVVKMVNTGNSKSYSFSLNFKVIAVGRPEIRLEDCFFADGNNEYSATGSSIVLQTDKAVNNAVPDAPSVSYYTANAVVLNGIEGCEYSIDGINWQQSTHFATLEAERQYSFYQRFKETSTVYAGKPSVPLIIVTGAANNGIRGDVDQNGSPNAADLALLKKIIAGINESYDKGNIDPDVDKSGGVPNAADLALLKKIIAGLA